MENHFNIHLPAMTSEQYVKAYLAQDAYLVVNKAFVQTLGLTETVLLSLLLDRHTYFSQTNQIDNGWFYCTGESLQDTLNIGRRPLDAALKNLETAHLVEIQRKGLPAKKYFRLSFDNIKTATETLNQVCAKRSNLYNQNEQTYNNNKDNNNKDIDNSSLRSELSESLLSTTTTEKNNSSSTTPYSPPSKAKPKFDLSFIADEFRADYTVWLDYRKEINKPFKTQRSIELNYKAALCLSDNDPKVFKQIIEQSIANGWQGLFELKNTNHNGTTSSNGSRSATRAERPEPKEPDYNFFSF